MSPRRPGRSAARPRLVRRTIRRVAGLARCGCGGVRSARSHPVDTRALRIGLCSLEDMTVAADPDPYFALPKLYGGPAYVRPPRGSCPKESAPSIPTTSRSRPS